MMASLNSRKIRTFGGAAGRRYFYHMTDGICLIVDQVGRRYRSKRQITPEALRQAKRVMQSAPPSIDWSDWQISVQDQDGYAVVYLPFPVNRA